MDLRSWRRSAVLHALPSRSTFRGEIAMAWLSVMLLVAVLVALALVVQAVSIYNGLVQVKHQVDQAWSNVDVLLKQRHDELPKLVDALKGYVSHERSLLESVTAMRT